MKRATRFLGLLVCVMLMLVTALSGCAAPASDTAVDSSAPETSAPAGETAADGTPPSDDLSKEVNLSMYLIGDPAKDYDAMLAELAKKLKPDLNATLTVNWVSWGDFSTKYPLILASGEPIDLIYASTWTNFYQLAQKGAFMPIEKLAPQYAPKSYASYDEKWLKQAEINGHLYAFPANFSQVGMMGYIVRGDLMDKYNIPEIHSLDDYGVFLEAIAKNEKSISPGAFFATSDGMDGYFIREKHHYVNLTNWIYYDIDTGKVVDGMEVPEMPAFFAKMKTWADKGYWSKSVLSNKDDQMFTEGIAASRLHNQDSWNTAYVQQPEWEPRFYWSQSYGVSTVAMQDAMAIPASAQNPERALMFLEKLKTDKAYYYLMTYGLEGVHYEITADNLIKPLDADAFAPEGYCSWGFKDPNFYLPLVGSPPNLQQVKDQLKSMAIDNPYQLFTINSDPIKNELAALSDVMVQYEYPLTFGLVADPVAGLAELKEKMKAAGIEKVMAELQKQMDEFKAANSIQ